MLSHTYSVSIDPSSANTHTTTHMYIYPRIQILHYINLINIIYHQKLNTWPLNSSTTLPVEFDSIPLIHSCSGDLLCSILSGPLS